MSLVVLSFRFYTCCYLESFPTMTTTEMTCLFHSRRYASNIQRIFNLLRKNKIKVKCDLNYIGKRALCICKLSGRSNANIR